MIARPLVALAALTLAASAPVEGARVFEPGLISGPDNDFALAIAPHASVLLFTRGVDGRSSILQSHSVIGRWTKPKTASFSGRWIDLEPAWSPDGSFVVFASNRPHDGGARTLTAHYYGKEQTGGALWRVDYTASRWGTPRRLADEINRGGSVWTPTIAGDGALYYMTTDPGTGRFRLYRAEHAYADRPRVRELAFSDGAYNDVDPYVTPDQSHLIFSSDRDQAAPAKSPGPERLFVAFNPRGKVPLVCPMKVVGFDDPTVSMVEARLSPDRRTLYFASRRLAHAEGETTRGDWDNGKANIWEAPFTPTLWRFDGASVRCRKAR